MRRVFFGILIASMLFGSTDSAEGAPEVAPARRRVFVLHSGMHIILAPSDKNHAARTLKQLLAERGIAERDLVRLESPFPTASWSDVVPRDGLIIYLESTDPGSKTCQEAYVRLDKALRAQGVTATDDLVWIGHSAGGQIGMSMARLAHNLEMFPELAKKARPYHFDMVITLGSAVGSNPVPENVKLRHYYSDGDVVIGMLSKHGNLLSDSMGFKVRFCPCCDLRADATIRVFNDIEHPAWYTQRQVLDRILNEFKSDYCPVWRRTQADVGTGLGLAQLIASALESDWHISLEEERH